MIGIFLVFASGLLCCRSLNFTTLGDVPPVRDQDTTLRDADTTRANGRSVSAASVLSFPSTMGSTVRALHFSPDPDRPPREGAISLESALYTDGGLETDSSVWDSVCPMHCCHVG